MNDATPIMAPISQNQPASCRAGAPRFDNRPRLRREWQTISAMARIYCRDHHQPGPGFCAECQALLDYAWARLDRCRFREKKPTCASCPVHCYQHEWREKVKTVMRQAGPKMVWRHPMLSFRHWMDGFGKAL